MKTIMTVEERGALPEGAVIAFEDIGTPNAAVLASTEDGPRWWRTLSLAKNRRNLPDTHVLSITPSGTPLPAGVHG